MEGFHELPDNTVVPHKKALQPTISPLRGSPAAELGRWASTRFREGGGAMRISVVRALACSSLVILAASAAEPLPGEKLFLKHCASCHSFGCNQAAPKLEGIFGRRAGSVIDYKNYSSAMRNSDVVWSEKTIDAFIYDPNEVVPGTPMAAVVFVEKAEDRQEIISYLRRQDKRNDTCQ